MQLNNADSSRLHPDLITKKVPLATKTWFGTGGLAKYYAEPKTADEFSTVLRWAHAHDQSIVVIGEGANILISDDGVDGLLIRPGISHLNHKKVDETYTHVTAGAGISFETLITYCLTHCLCGLEEFSGIPGSIGGALFINIHYFEFLLSQYLVHARVIHKDTGEVQTVDAKWFNFGYDYSRLHDEPYCVVDATFKVKNANLYEAAYARGRSEEITRHRTRRYPNHGTCGSFFRNFHDHEVSIVSNGRKMIFIAYYLDKLGIKGELRHGNAQVSYQHANMIVNMGNASSSDIISLARHMQELVYTEFGIIPQPECQLIGFDPYPLL